MAAFGSGSGVVEEFDEQRGLGTIVAADGDVLPFHCTAIADGSRNVEPGRRVQFSVVPGLSGRWVATRVEKL
jgi:cold shock CspA family protein